MGKRNYFTVSRSSVSSSGCLVGVEKDSHLLEWHDEHVREVS